MHRRILFSLLVLGFLSSSLEAQKFYPDDPLLADNDKVDVPEKPEEIELSDLFDRFGHMNFTNLSEQYGFVDAETRYQMSWSSFDNLSGEHQRLSEPVTSREPRLELPESGSEFLRAEIHSLNDENLHWNIAVSVYLRRNGSGYEIIGIERENPEMFTFPMR